MIFGAYIVPHLLFLRRFAPAVLACLLALPSAPTQAEDITAIRCGQLLNSIDAIRCRTSEPWRESLS